MREDLQQWRSKSNLCDGVNSKSAAREPSTQGHRGRRGCCEGGYEQKAEMCTFLKSDISPKHKQGGGQASGRLLLLQGNYSSEEEDKPAIKSFAAAQVVPFKSSSHTFQETFEVY